MLVLSHASRYTTARITFRFDGLLPYHGHLQPELVGSHGDWERRSTVGIEEVESWRSRTGPWRARNVELSSFSQRASRSSTRRRALSTTPRDARTAARSDAARARTVTSVWAGEAAAEREPCTPWCARPVERTLRCPSSPGWAARSTAGTASPHSGPESPEAGAPTVVRGAAVRARCPQCPSAEAVCALPRRCAPPVRWAGSRPSLDPWDVP